MKKGLTGYGVTLLLWAVIGVICVVAFRYAMSESGPEVKQNTVAAVKKVPQAAADVKKIIAEDPQMQQMIPKAQEALNKLSRKITGQAKPPAETVPEKVEPESKERISSAHYSNDKKQQDLFDRQVAIVNDLL